MTHGSEPPAPQHNRFNVLDEMSIQERSCLLRAARERIRLLNEMAESFHLTGNKKELELVLSEIVCLQAAISWVWRQHIAI
jgi:hypothetical protein